MPHGSNTDVFHSVTQYDDGTLDTSTWCGLDLATIAAPSADAPMCTDCDVAMRAMRAARGVQ